MSLPAVPTVKVWDWPVRLLHWTLVGSIALGWLTTFLWFGAHQPVGWIALAAVALRLVWGFAGSRHARFAQFVRTPRATFVYLRQMRRGSAPRHLGHNPLGAWMINALLLCVTALCVTGWLYTTDALWGNATVDMLHRGFAWGLLGLIVLHVGGVIFTSLRQRENLVRSMLNGAKRAPRDDDVV
jgi:cytochrome b